MGFLCLIRFPRLTLLQRCRKVPISKIWKFYYLSNFNATNIVYSTIHVPWKDEGHRKSTLKKIVQIGKIFFATKNPQVLVDRTQHPPFLHPTPLFLFFSFFHFHGLEICKTAIICRFLIASVDWYVYILFYIFLSHGNEKNKKEKKMKKGGDAVYCPQVPVEESRKHK